MARRDTMAIETWRCVAKDARGVHHGGTGSTTEIVARACYTAHSVPGCTVTLQHRPAGAARFRTIETRTTTEI
jgi:hypothetical protein